VLPSSWISPTAHYTGHVWWRNGLSHPAFRTGTGRAFFAALEPINQLSRITGGPTLEAMLIARHRVIDHLLETAIAAGEIDQVLEVAAGLSPRGHRFVERYPELIYVEADLPGMAARKRDVLEAAGSLSDRHPVVTIDALADDGPESVGAICERTFERDRGVAILTEGLINYFPTATVEGIWARFAAALEPFTAGLYLSDLTCDEDIGQIRGGRAFRLLLNQLTRGSQHRYFSGAEETCAALIDAGFVDAELHFAADFAADFAALDVGDLTRTARVRIIEARRHKSIGPP
jgi:O-methyltransferase involved in polyketide biosynthesis